MQHIIAEDIEQITASLENEAQALSGKTLVLSGAAGFLGSYHIGVLHRLNETVLKKPCRVIGVDNYITGSKDSFALDIKDPNISWMEADVTKPLKIAGPVDYIIHAAGLASPAYYKKFPLETIDAAISGAKNLLELSRQKQISSFLLFSSSEVYGDPDPNFIPTPEHYRGNVSPVGPRACYDESKRLAETLCHAYHDVYGTPIRVVRPFNVYGPGMKINDYRVIPTFIMSALEGKPLRVHGTGNQTRTFCYVSDAVTGFFKVLLSGTTREIYNVGADGPEVNMAALADFIASLSGSAVKSALVDYPASYPGDEPNRRCPDLAKIKRELGYRPQVELQAGLARTIDWYRDISGGGAALF